MSPITESQYWAARFQWARANTDLWTRKKFVSGPIVGIIAYFLQWELGLRLMIPTLQFIITIIVAYFLVALFSLVGNWIYYAPVVLERERVGSIDDLTQDLKQAHAALAPDSRPYSELQLTKLSRLKQEGRSLLEHHISPNQSGARQELETWIKNHREWRREILEILNEKDATVFEAPVTFTNTNFQIPGLPAAFNLDHARLRNQLLGEISRLEEILKQKSAD